MFLERHQVGLLGLLRFCFCDIIYQYMFLVTLPSQVAGGRERPFILGKPPILDGHPGPGCSCISAPRLRCVVLLSSSAVHHFIWAWLDWVLLVATLPDLGSSIE